MVGPHKAEVPNDRTRLCENKTIYYTKTHLSNFESGVEVLEFIPKPGKFR